MRLMLVTTLANCASKASGSAPCASKPGMPDTNRRSPLRAANDSGGALMPGGARKCLMVMAFVQSGGVNRRGPASREAVEIKERMPYLFQRPVAWAAFFDYSSGGTATAAVAELFIQIILE